MEVKIENVDSKFNFFVRVDTREFKYILDSESKIKEYILNQVQNLENDEKRKALVDDFQTADKLQQSFLKWNRLNKNILSLEEIKAAYEKIKNDYVGDTKRSVQESFDSISTHVSAYFRARQ
jgi:CRISPR/Cas system-associated endonuclease Cas1